MNELFILLFFLTVLFIYYICSAKKALSRPETLPIVIGVYNKADSIENTLREKAKQNPGTKIIAVDMGSTDDTVKIIKLLSKSYPLISVVERYPKNILLR